MKITVKDSKGLDHGELEVKFSIIENAKGTQAVHDAVVAHNAGRRSGTACTKTAGEVNGTNKKPWKQKGTGRARAGSFQSPLWRGGGVVFGPKPRDFSKKLGRSARQLALRKALSARLQAGDVIIIEELKLESPKTKGFLGLLSALQISGTTLVVSGETDHNLLLASRNVPGVTITTGGSLNTYEVLRSDKLLFTRGAFDQVEKRLAGE
jgi:large subunit ribosomal protein L4